MTTEEELDRIYGEPRRRPPSSRRPAPAAEIPTPSSSRSTARRSPSRPARRSSRPPPRWASTRPTLCYADTLTPVNVCRVCVVEVAGARVLAPACSRKVEPGMDVQTDSRARPPGAEAGPRAPGLLGRLSLAGPSSPTAIRRRYLERYDADPARFGPRSPPAEAGDRDARQPGHHHEPDGAPTAETVHQPVKVDNDLYVRDYSRCILCYKCVEACGTDAQNTFAIAVAGRGFDARISTEFAVPLPESACVYCGNCINVCPTGALMFRSEHELRAAGTWDEAQTVTDTICPYCGVGCTLSLHVQDERIVKVLSPFDSASPTATCA